MQALLFASNVDERAILQVVLQRIGISARIVKDLDQAAGEWPSQPADLTLIAFGGEDGMPSRGSVQAFLAAPLIIITDQIPEDLQAELYEAGIDLLVMRPYSARILILQIQALLRRSTGVPFFTLPCIERGVVSLDPSKRTIQIQEREPKYLTQLEFRLLYTLMMHPEQVFPSDRLVEHIWGYSGQGDRDLVRGLIRRLRVKIEPDPQSPRFIVTIPRVGYMFKYKG